MRDTGYLPRDKWTDFVTGLTKDYQVYAPCKDGDTVIFQAFQPGKEMCLDRPAALSPKSVIFPQSETLFTFTFNKDPEKPQKTDIELKADTEYPQTIIIGGRPCDSRGFTVYDRVYMDADPYYAGRRNKTTIVTMTCAKPFAACFCTSVDGGPVDKLGSDVMVTEIENGYFLEATTDKGKTLLDNPLISDGNASQKEAHDKQEQALRSLPPAKSRARIREELFHDDAFWDDVAAKCVSCGVCTYTCPTCYCFNITDENAVFSGERIRSWDACMFHHFTLEASGHNPRSKKAQRLKNRIGHKFVYYPEKHGVLACSGCGRCIRNCPVSMEISRIVAVLSGETGGGDKEQKSNVG